MTIYILSLQIETAVDDPTKSFYLDSHRFDGEDRLKFIELQAPTSKKKARENKGSQKDFPNSQKPSYLTQKSLSEPLVHYKKKGWFDPADRMDHRSRGKTHIASGSTTRNGRRDKSPSASIHT